jgi:dTDP-4-amino-4,6-dideoxygalactose transaminase
MTFSASANPIKYLGAHPVFIDSEPDTWNMCPNHLEKALISLHERGKSVKAIIPVHLYGMPAKMNVIKEIGNRYDVPILEDAAEALGSHYYNKPCGSLGDLGVLSFNGNKIITTSGGGALLSNHRDWIEKARFLATQARDPAPHYQHSSIGYNYRMSNVLAGIGLGQMEVLSQRIELRRSIHELYRKWCNDWQSELGLNISFQEETIGLFSNRWLTCILVDPEKNNGLTREAIRLYLEKENIESRPLWKPMHLQPVFQKDQYWGSGIAEKLFDQGLCLPSGSNLTSSDKERIFTALETIILKYLR